jgi:peptide/nickel transport system substrate-binding protein
MLGCASRMERDHRHRSTPDCENEAVTKHTIAKVAVYSVDPPAIDAFNGFDPESWVVVSALNDGLVHCASDGEIRPALAVSWERVSPLTMDFELREGVQFHDGSPFDADSVVATFDAHHDPKLGPSQMVVGVLSPLAACTKLDRYRVRIETKFPDAMFLRRMTSFVIYPRGPLEKHGREYFRTHPVGTGAYRLERWTKKREIVLTRNPDHWARRATVDEIRIPILRQKEWIGCLARGEVDVAWNIDAHDAIRARRTNGLEAASGEAAVSQWFLLANRGPLADERVRHALNHAIHRGILVEIAEQGLGRPQLACATAEQEGYAPGIPPIRYSPELARELLSAAGHSEGFTLRGLVSETSTSLYLLVREFLSRVGVHLEAEVVPRSEWLHRVGYRKQSGTGDLWDFAVASIDNPMLHSLFHQFIFFFSQGVFSLLNDPEYDQRFLATATQVNEADALAAQRSLEHYVRDKALMLFTVQQQVHAAWRSGFHVTLPRSGHFNSVAFWELKCTGPAEASKTLRPMAEMSPDMELLFDATSHTGSFYLRPGSTFSDPATKQVWRNLTISEERWHIQNEPMIRTLVRDVEAKNHLANVLDSTTRVAIAGYSKEGRCLFLNSGYERMIGAADGPPAYELLERAGEARWDVVRAQVDTTGSWLGPVHLPAEGRPVGAPQRLYLTVSPALDEESMAIGYTFVFSDFSGEEERIRHQAIRAILDNVPYGLLRCDHAGNVMGGYSASCAQFFQEKGPFEGKPLVTLLGLDARSAGVFSVNYEQIIDDVLPESLAFSQLPVRHQIGDRHVSITGSVIRDDNGKLESVLLTLLDIRQLIDAERDAERANGVLQVMLYRDTFEGFVRGFDAALELIIQAPPGTEREGWARRELHKAKGTFAQFGLIQLARAIHTIEDLAEISTDALVGLRSAIGKTLRANEQFWGITIERARVRYTLSDSALFSIEERLASASSLEAARAVVASAFAEIRERTASELLGPIQESCLQHAMRRSKSVRLIIEGADVRCPQRLAPLFALLPQFVRNSIDHGIEGPDDRGGKPAEASIRVGVRRSGGAVLISIADDGRGIDVPKVVAAAIARGQVTPAAVARMSPEEQLALICLPGLSTSESVTDTSGRGVGMSAVKAEIESLGGTLAIETIPGQGTTMIVRVAD